MIFRRKQKEQPVEEEQEEIEFQQEELETVLFQGALYGREANLAANEKLVRSVLVPAKQLVSEAIDRNAEKMTLEPRSNMSIVRFDIDGVGYAGNRYPKNQAMGLTQMIKVLAGLDPNVRDKKQSGGIRAEFLKIKYDLEVEVEPTQRGPERLMMKIQNLKEAFHSAEEIGFSEELREKIRSLGSNKQGLIIACGPPESGVTTTLHGTVMSMDMYLYTVFNMQKRLNPDLIPGVSNYDYDDNLDVPENIVRAARKEADGAVVEAIKNAEDAKTFFANCNKMTLFTEMTAPSAAAAINKLVKWLGDPKIVAENLIAVISSKLIRKLRDDIKEAYRPNPKLVAKLGLPSETNILYRPPMPDEEGNVYYEGLPFEGRTAVFDMIELNDDIKKLILSGASDKEISKKAKELGMPTQQQGALELVSQGFTSLDEVSRVFKS